ncbi:MAG: MarR family transcriptional regulator [bacterium]
MTDKQKLVESIDLLTRKIEEIEVDVIENSELVKLSRKQLYYLDIINQMNNPTLGELTTKLGLSKPSITAIVEKLVQSAYVVKVKSDDDRRVSHIHLGEKGKMIAQLHDDIHSRIEEFLTKSLDSKETEQLTAILSKAVSE